MIKSGILFYSILHCFLRGSVEDVAGGDSVFLEVVFVPPEKKYAIFYTVDEDVTLTSFEVCVPRKTFLLYLSQLDFLECSLFELLKARRFRLFIVDYPPSSEYSWLTNFVDLVWKKINIEDTIVYRIDLIEEDFSIKVIYKR